MTVPSKHRQHHASTGASEPSSGRRPWFERRPAHAAVVALGLFIAIFALRFAVGDESDAIAMLYVLPIALFAIGFGRRVGTGAGVLAVVLLMVWALVEDVALSPLGWWSRVVPLMLIGMLVGHATDRMRAADAADRRADAIALLQLDGAEINDHIVQSLAAAKWAIEAGDVERAGTILDDTIVAGQRLVTRVLGSDGIAAE